MLRGRLIGDLFDAVEKAERSSGQRPNGAGAEPAKSPAGRDRSRANIEQYWREQHSRTGLLSSSESEQLPQPLGLGPADGDLGLLLVVHPQLVGTLEPGDDFPDSVNVDQVGAVSPPKKIGV